MVLPAISLIARETSAFTDSLQLLLLIASPYGHEARLGRKLHVEHIAYGCAVIVLHHAAIQLKRLQHGRIIDQGLHREGIE